MGSQAQRCSINTCTHPAPLFSWGDEKHFSGDAQRNTQTHGNHSAGAHTLQTPAVWQKWAMETCLQAGSDPGPLCLRTPPPLTRLLGHFPPVLVSNDTRVPQYKTWYIVVSTGDCIYV